MNIEQFIQGHPEVIDVDYVEKYINEQIVPLLEINKGDADYINKEIASARKCMQDMFIEFSKWEVSETSVFSKSEISLLRNIVKVYVSNKKRLHILTNEQKSKEPQPIETDAPQLLLHLFGSEAKVKEFIDECNKTKAHGKIIRVLCEQKCSWNKYHKIKTKDLYYAFKKVGLAVWHQGEDDKKAYDRFRR